MRIKQVVSEPSFKYFLIGFVVLVGLTATTIYAAGRFMPPKDDKVALSDQNNQNNQDGQQQLDDELFIENQNKPGEGDSKTPPVDSGDNKPAADKPGPTNETTGGQPSSTGTKQPEDQTSGVILPGELSTGDDQADDTATTAPGNTARPAATDETADDDAMPTELTRTGPGETISQIVAIAGISFMVAYYYQSHAAVKKQL